jgi:hypothetical protein
MTMYIEIYMLLMKINFERKGFEGKRFGKKSTIL